MSEARMFGGFGEGTPRKHMMPIETL